MKRILLLASLVFALTLAFTPSAQAGAWLSSPYTNSDAVWEATRDWYPRCQSVLLEYRKVSSSPEKWRFLHEVCKNPVEACATGTYWQSDTGRWYYFACGHIPRNFDTWCWNGTNIRVRDLYHGWEKVTSVPCVKWYN